MVNVVGVDFGTSNSCVAGAGADGVVLIRDDRGAEKTPSVVFYPADGPAVVGDAAWTAWEDAQQDAESAAGLLVGGIKRRLLSPPRIGLPGGGSIRPVEVAAAIIGKLHADAVAALGQAESHAVVTHPAVFDPAQIAAVQEAAVTAGFAAVEMQEEPVTAAIAFERHGGQVGHGVLVYDFGGGTFDVAFVVREPGGTRFELAIEPDGDPACGGEDIDQLLYEHFDTQARRECGRGISPVDGQVDTMFLRNCRRRKENLSRSRQASFSILLDDGQRLTSVLTRDQFEDLITPIIERTIRITERTASAAAAAGYTLDTALLVGGSSQIPLISRRISETLGITPQTWAHRDYAVALGAAHHATTLWTTHRPSPPATATTTTTAPATDPEPSNRSSHPSGRQAKKTEKAQEPGESSPSDSPRPAAAGQTAVTGQRTESGLAALYQKALAASSKGQWELAAARYRQIVDQVPSYRGAQDRLAHALKRVTNADPSRAPHPPESARESDWHRTVQDTEGNADRPAKPSYFDLEFDTICCAIEVSPDGEWITLGCYDMKCYMLRLKPGQREDPLMHRRNHPAGLRGVFRRVAEFGDIPIVRGVAFSPDGLRMASVGDDTSARIWDVKSRREVLALEHGCPLGAVRFSPDGHTVATGPYLTGDDISRVWESGSGKQVMQLSTGRVEKLLFSKDGRRLFALGHEISVWDAQGGRQLGETSFPGVITDMALSQTGDRLIVGGFEGIAIWQGDCSREILRITNEHVYALAISPDERSIYAVLKDGQIAIFDAENGNTVGVIGRVHILLHNYLAITPDGAHLIGSSPQLSGDVRVWKIEGGQPSAT